MQRITPSLKNEVVFLAASGIYLAAILFLFPYLQFYVDNPDSISYITIASKYFHHDYPNAINGYWSPLISWILALIFNIPKDPVFLFKMLQLLIGWFAIFNIGKLVQGLIHSMLIQTVIIFSAIPLVLNYALLNLTAEIGRAHV